MRFVAELALWRFHDNFHRPLRPQRGLSALMVLLKAGTNDLRADNAEAAPVAMGLRI